MKIGELWAWMLCTFSLSNPNLCLYSKWHEAVFQSGKHVLCLKIEIRFLWNPHLLKTFLTLMSFQGGCHWGLGRERLFFWCARAVDVPLVLPTATNALDCGPRRSCPPDASAFCRMSSTPWDCFWAFSLWNGKQDSYSSLQKYDQGSLQRVFEWFCFGSSPPYF